MREMRKVFAVASILFVLGASGLAVPTTPPCEYDDGANAPCYWDAQTMGNGVGHSFIVDVNRVVTYVG